MIFLSPRAASRYRERVPDGTLPVPLPLAAARSLRIEARPQETVRRQCDLQHVGADQVADKTDVANVKNLASVASL
jgi:hypothetical protein